MDCQKSSTPVPLLSKRHGHSHVPDKSKKRRHRHSKQDWEDIRERFKTLYLQEDRTLEGVMESMRVSHGFEASERQYKVKIKEWQLEKNIKASDMKILLAKRNQRKQEKDARTVFLIRDIKLDSIRLERFATREHDISEDHVSWSVATPEGVTYYTPRSAADVGSPNPRGDDTLIMLNDHHYSETGSMTFAETNFEYIEHLTKESLAPRLHPHRGAQLGLVSRGRLSGNDQASWLLWQARNFAISLKNLVVEKNVPEEGASFAHPRSSSALPAPRYCVTSQIAEGSGVEQGQQLVDLVKFSKLSQSIVGLGVLDEPRWLGDWQVMEDDLSARVQSEGNLLFGDPALPYPGMTAVSLWIRFDKSASKTNGSLLRICLCFDSGLERRDCEFCHNTFMVLDFMEPEGVLRANIPLLRSSLPVSDCDSFRRRFLTTPRTFEFTWREADYIYQGMTHMNECKGHKLRDHGMNFVHLVENAEKETDEEELVCLKGVESAIFEPFPNAKHLLLCPDNHGLWSQLDVRDATTPNQCSSDEEMSFDPFPSD